MSQRFSISIDENMSPIIVPVPCMVD